MLHLQGKRAHTFVVGARNVPALRSLFPFSFYKSIYQLLSKRKGRVTPPRSATQRGNRVDCRRPPRRNITRRRGSSQRDAGGREHLGRKHRSPNLLRMSYIPP